ncbi:hypothetical protein ES703_69952 [subsurface metagenome]
MKNPETFNQACYEVAREIADLVINNQPRLSIIATMA